MQTSADLFPVTSQAQLQGNQAEPRPLNQGATDKSAHMKDKHRQSQLGDGAEVSIDDQSDDDIDDETASSGDEVDDETAESDLKPYIFSSDGMSPRTATWLLVKVFIHLLVCRCQTLLCSAANHPCTQQPQAFLHLSWLRGGVHN